MITIECDTCRNELTVSLHNETIYVEPCEVCIHNAEEIATQEGYDEGFAEAERVLK